MKSKITPEMIAVLAASLTLAEALEYGADSAVVKAAREAHDHLSLRLLESQRKKCRT